MSSTKSTMDGDVATAGEVEAGEAAHGHGHSHGHGHGHGLRAKLRLTRQRTIVLMLILTIGFFFTEIVVGYIAESLALIADAFHMFSDIVALIIAIYAIRVAKKPATYVICAR